jgi:uncharacterized protein (TIGR00725 family)
MTRYVAVVGPSSPADPTLLHQATDAGRLLAGRGWMVVTGGLGGVMAAAAAGVEAAGGTAVALLPGSDRRAASAGHQVVIPTGLGEMRNALVVRAVDAVLAIGGSWGTLSEVALALRTGVPVVSLGGWDLSSLPDGDTATPGPVVCGTAAEAVERIAQVLGRTPQR